MNSRGCLNSLIAGLLFLLGCFVVGLAVQLVWLNSAPPPPEPTPTPTIQPSPTEEPTATAAPSPTATLLSTATPEPTPTRTPRATRTPAPTRTATPQPTTYEVQPGDTFTLIAEALGIDVDALAEANPEVEPTLLRPGDILQLPSPESE